LGQWPQQASTVVVAAQRPVKQPTADAEARIRKIVSRQATAFEGLLSLCLNAPITNLDFKVMCGRSHIQAKDKSLGEGLDAFDNHDYTIALQRFEAAYAKAGYPDAALIMAHIHRHGLGTPKDAVQGIRWLRAVAEDRFDPHRDWMRFNPGKPDATNARIDAAMALARAYQLGGEVERDWAEAERWYVRAAEFGFVPAWNTLGEAYLSGEGASKNVGQAIDCFTKAAKAGYGLAAYNLGNLYYLGRDGVVRDPDQAYSYFSMAAEAGHPDAQLAIGQIHALDDRAQASNKASAAQRSSRPAAAVIAGGANSVMESPAVGDTVDMVSDTLHLALSKLASNPSDAEAFRNLRWAADELNIAASPPAESHGQAGEVLAQVRVTGFRAVPWKSYGAMRAAVSAYEKNKSLAPDAVFSFAVMPPAGTKLPPNFALRVRTEKGLEFPIILEEGELFTLPLLPGLAGEADLVSNFKGGTLRIGLLVHTRTVSPEKLRLGDLRLRYEINAAIAMFDKPWEYDSQCRATGRWSRCKRPRTVIWHRPWTATSGAWIVEGSRRTPLKANDDSMTPMYRMPVAGEQWGNDAIIEFDYKVPLLRPRKLSEAAIYDASD
jgi:TPR repeat protein